MHAPANLGMEGQMKSDHGPELTQREFQVLELVAQGYSAKEVAQEINIAPRTVEGHIDTIKLKLRARNRAHMITRAIAAHLLTIRGDRSPRAPVSGFGGIQISEVV
jgi:DNA-binding CsgD family transcriptional regulator